MKPSTAIAAVLAAALLVPGEAALAKTNHPAHAAAAHHVAKGHASGSHAKAAHGKAGHGKATKGKHAKPEKAGRHGKKAKAVKAPKPPPPPKPQILTPPSRADRVVLPTNVIPSHYDITVAPDAAGEKFTGRVRIDVEVKSATRQIKLNAADLTFDSVSLSGPTGAALTPKWSIDPKV